MGKIKRPILALLILTLAASVYTCNSNGRTTGTTQVSTTPAKDRPEKGVQAPIYELLFYP